MIFYFFNVQINRLGIDSFEKIIELKSYLPANLLVIDENNQSKEQLQKWFNLMRLELMKISNHTVKMAKIKFLEIIQKWHLFGATFFHANVRIF